MVILPLVCMTVAGCQRDASFLPTQFDSVTIYSLECNFDNSSLPADAELFHGNLVLGKRRFQRKRARTYCPRFVPTLRRVQLPLIAFGLIMRYGWWPKTRNSTY